MMNHRILGWCALALLLGGCAHEGDHLPEVVQIEKITPYHRVTEGDTVGSVARQYGMKQSDLIRLNNLRQPYQLYNGQKLIVSPKINGSSNLSAPADPDISIRENSWSEPQHVAPDEGAIEGAKEDNATVDDVMHSENVATVSEYGYPAITIDMGTATTIFAVDKNGAFIGGAIMPGLKLSLTALTAWWKPSAALPCRHG